MKRFAPVLGAVVLILATPLLAFAASVSWTGGSGSGSDVLPCTDGGHWVLSQAKAVKSATLVVAGGTYQMQRDGKDAYAADSSGPIVIGDLAVVTYSGGGQPALALTACDASSSPTPTPTPTPSPSPTGSPPPSSPPPSGQGGGGSGQPGTSGRTPTLHGGAAAATDPSVVGNAPGHDPHGAGTLPAGLAGPLDPTSSHAADPSNVVIGAADGAVQQAWNDGSADPFQDVRHPPRALVIAVIAIVGIGLGGVFLARHRLIRGSP